jgi:aryl-alcohol dehydrogenase-like predicted oxidoreductase
MEFRNIGKSGLRVSVVGVGCNNFGGRLDLEGTRAVIDHAIASGITMFDTADSYGKDGGSERLMGEVLGAKRKDIVLATKFGFALGDGPYKKGGSRHYIMNAVEASLRRLKTDWIDLYQFHRPDADTPMEETLRTLDDLIHQGKVRYIGISNHPSWQVVDADWTAQAHGLNKFISCQDEYSLLVRGFEKDLAAALGSRGIGLLPFLPLAGGMLTGKYVHGEAAPAGTRMAEQARFSARFFTDVNWTKVNGLKEFAERQGHTLLELAFSWLAAQPHVSCIIAGATKPVQIDSNIQAVSWKLTAEELAEIDILTK